MNDDDLNDREVRLRQDLSRIEKERARRDRNRKKQPRMTRSQAIEWNHQNQVNSNHYGY